jgi:hypothetical protein
MFKSNEWKKYKFDCNIQQVKRKEFDTLYYGIFFSDRVAVFKISGSDIGSAINYSDKQHKGNIGEGQFHLNQDTYAYHLENHLVVELTYAQILKLLLKLQNSHRGAKVMSVLLSLFM